MENTIILVVHWSRFFRAQRIVNELQSQLEEPYVKIKVRVGAIQPDYWQLQAGAGIYFDTEYLKQATEKINDWWTRPQFIGGQYH